MQLWRSARQQAGKLAFEADKLVRIRREEAAVARIRQDMRARYADLGEITYKLSQEGAVQHPEISAWAQTIARLEERLGDGQRVLTEIRREQWVEDTTDEYAGGPPLYAGNTAYAAPTRRCPKCGYAAPAGASFCPRCSQSLAAPSSPPDPEKATRSIEPDIEVPELPESAAENNSQTTASEPVLVCERCGAKITTGAAFCLECGAPAPS